MGSAIQLIYSAGKLLFRGTLTMETVPDAERQLCALRSKLNSSFEVDLADIDTADTAGIAMLINLKARYDKNNSVVGLINASESLKKLSKLSDADKLLQI